MVEVRSFHFSARVVITGGKWRVVGVGRSVKGGQEDDAGGDACHSRRGAVLDTRIDKDGRAAASGVAANAWEGQYPGRQRSPSYPLSCA